MNAAMIYLKFAVVALACFVTWYATSDHYQKQLAQQNNKWLQAYSAATDAALAAQQQTDKFKHDAEVQHGKDQLAINDLASRIGRMRIHIPAGCETDPKADTTCTCADGTSGIFPGGVDAAFAELQAGVGRLIQRCDQLNIDAIRLNTELQ
jgi:hypothetical protein